MRVVAAIQSELDIAQAELEAATERRNALRVELREAKVREAQQNGHPWLGKKVKRNVITGYRRIRKTQTGILTIYDPTEYRGLRGIYTQEPGSLIVVSASGKTGYRFLTPEQIENGHYYGEDRVPWELA